MASTSNRSISKSDEWVSVTTDPMACSITANNGFWYPYMKITYLLVPCLHSSCLLIDMYI